MRNDVFSGAKLTKVEPDVSDEFAVASALFTVEATLLLCS